MNTGSYETAIVCARSSGLYRGQCAPAPCALLGLDCDPSRAHVLRDIGHQLRHYHLPENIDPDSAETILQVYCEAFNQGYRNKLGYAK
jgi:hypothetical protein